MYKSQYIVPYKRLKRKCLYTEYKHSLIAFLVYQANIYRVKQARDDKARIAQAKEYKAAHAIA